MRTIPTGEKLFSITFLVCYVVAFLGCLSYAGAGFVVQSTYFGHIPSLDSHVSGTALSLLTGFVILLLTLAPHIVFYRRHLGKRHERTVLEQEATSIGVRLTESR